jgi:hypothetical protein
MPHERKNKGGRQSQQRGMRQQGQQRGGSRQQEQTGGMSRQPGEMDRDDDQGR